ncbi:MAG: ABC transporter permease [Clostridia bacterium]|nr:ABC transporter permease [Clostridia bacterium]
MRKLAKLTWVEFKLLFREPVVVFFTLAFPVMMLFLFGAIYGNRPSPLFGGLGTIDISVPAYMCMIIATAGLISLPVTVSSYRENGVLRRLSATPVGTTAILTAQVVVNLGITLVGAALLVTSARLAYHVRFSGSAASIVLALVFASLSFLSLGFMLTGFTSTSRAALAVSMAVMYPMLFLSGASIPREMLPSGVKRFGEFLPLTHVVTLMRGLWVGDSWGAHLKEVWVLAAVLVVSVAVSARTFRYES